MTNRSKAWSPVVILLAALTLAGGCLSTTGPDNPTVEDISDSTFAPALNVSLAQMIHQSTGLYYQDSVVGTGVTLASGMTASVTYTGWLTTGKQFDSNVGQTAFSFPIGYGYVILGWDYGLVGMKVGGTRKLVLPPALGYGPQTITNSSTGAVVIPGNSTLVFNVTLLGAQ